MLTDWAAEFNMETQDAPSHYLLHHHYSAAWWLEGIESISELLALCDGNPPVTGGFPSQRASNTGFGVFFDVSQNELLSKHLICQWFETPWCSCDVTVIEGLVYITVTFYDHHGVSNHWQFNCLFNNRFSAKNISKLCITDPLWGESTCGCWIPLTNGQ